MAKNRALVFSMSDNKWLNTIVLFFVVLAPFHTIVRRIRIESVLLSGWRDIIFIAILGAWLIRILTDHFELKPTVLVLIVLLFNFLGAVDVLRAPSLIVGLAGYRDIIKYSLLAVIVYTLCLKDPLLLRQITVVLFRLGVLIAILQFIFYFLNLDYIVRLGTIPPSYRALGPFNLRRMEAFFGGGPSNLGIYLGVPLVIYFSLQQLGHKVRMWWHMGALVMIAGIIMTTSFTAVIALGTIFTVLLVRHREKTMLTLFFTLILLAVFIGLNTQFDRAIVGDEEATDFQTYFVNIFSKSLFLNNLPLVTKDPGTFLFGRGLALVGEKTFLMPQPPTDIMIIGNSDAGWVEFTVQVGVPMALLILTSIGLTFRGALRHSRELPVDLRVCVWGLLAALVMMLSSVHIVPWNRVGLDANFWVVLGALAAVPSVALRTRTVPQLNVENRAAATKIAVGE